LIEIERPDVVIDEITERMLVNLVHRARGRLGNQEANASTMQPTRAQSQP
jgi:hypothetical protein